MGRPVTEAQGGADSAARPAIQQVVAAGALWQRFGGLLRLENVEAKRWVPVLEPSKYKTDSYYMG
jgi:hypothetical protein